jgi:Mrp family chromosome partitioning ATPase/capsular polysaccharide biosynthesis protein
MFKAPRRNYYRIGMGTEESLDLTPPPRAEEAAGTYLQAIGRYWPLVFGSVLLAVLAGLITLSRSGHNYEASASILVSPLSSADPTFNGTGVVIETGDPARTVQTAAALLNSRRASMMAAKAMGSGWDEARVQDAVNVTPRGQSNMLAVTARAPTAAEASKLATAFARSAVTSRAQIVQRNVGEKLRALNTQLERRRAAAATPAEQQELAVRIVQLETIRATGRDPTLQVAQGAQESTSPVGIPRGLLLLLCALVGFALGSVGAVALSYFSPRVGDAREVAALLPTPVLAGIPKVPYRQRRTGLGPTSMPPFAFEQFRKLRAQIANSDATSTIMVTSADPGDGKTTVAASLAAAFAEGKDEVILIDLNIRRPGLADVFGLEPAIGPMQVESASLTRMLVPAPGFPRLKVLSARQASIPVLERLVSRLPDLLDEARDVAKWIILDTPPIAEVGDALRFTSECDGVVLVVRPGHTDRSRLINVYNQLARVGARLMGTVINAERQAVRTGTFGDFHSVAFESPDAGQDRLRWAPPPTGSSASGTARAD